MMFSEWKNKIYYETNRETKNVAIELNKIQSEILSQLTKMEKNDT